MPFDSNGNCTINRNRAVTGQTVEAQQVNVPFDDVQSMLSQVLLRSGVAPMTGTLNMNGFRVFGAEDATSENDLVTLRQLKSVSPVGSVIDFSGNISPNGWLFCYGQAISRTDYSDLFSVIGISFGIGNGSTTFNIPDLRGRVVAGKDDMGGADSSRLSFFGSISKIIGGVFGSGSKSLSISEMPTHNHGGISGLSGSHSHTYERGAGGNGSGGSGSFTGASGVYQTGSVGDHQHSIPEQGSSVAFGIAQPSIIMNKIIKV